VHVRQLVQKWFTLKVGLRFFPRLTVFCTSYAINLVSLEGVPFCVRGFCVFREMFLGADCTQYTTLRCLQDDPSLKWHWVDPARRNILKGQSRWPRGLRLGSAAAGLLGLWVHIPPESWMSISCACRVLTGRALCLGLITRPEGFYRGWYVWVWSWRHDIEEAPGLLGALAP
jgi:hypothetical protein